MLVYVLKQCSKVYNIQGLGGKNINDMHETCLFFKFGNVSGEATCYSYHDGGRGHTVWSDGGVKNVLEMVAGELGLQIDEGDQVVRELLGLLWADGSKSQEYYDCGSTSCPDSDYYDPDEDSKG